MTKTKKRSRFFAVALVAVLMLALAVPSFALEHKGMLRDGPANAVSMQLNETNSFMNAMSESTVYAGTGLSLWPSTQHITQKFYTNEKRLYNKSNSQVCVGIDMNDSRAKFFSVNTPSDRILIEGELHASPNYYYFNLPAYERRLGAFGTNAGAYLYFADRYDNNARRLWTY